ncbi:NACHT domain protein [Rosistilla oblonga]|uniref:NACHT domain protein n=2 Tax=Rosistilla oblonga TaxID=2527990 RepID=A0A518ITJ7_9BACT|nr:NACHT domain protein [Rosistilla oblonga]
MAIVDGSNTITVDRKEYEGDLFDDLTIERDGKKVRRQFKSSANVYKEFSEESIKTKTSDLRIDDIVHCILSAGESPADEYRICTTWSAPTDESVAELLLPVESQSSFGEFNTRCFTLNVGKIWPEGGELKWNLRGGREFTRDQLLSIASRLIVELECPQITLDFSSPGPLQVLLELILTDRIGIGRYPNGNIRPADSAIRLTHRASLARAQQESLTPETILRDLNIRVDFGQVPQRFPVVRDQLVSRRATMERVLERVSAGGTVILTGEPGSGKSWCLTNFADEYSGPDSVVIRHYCFTEPGDEFRVQRITSNVLFGNLIAELRDAVPELAASRAARYSAGAQELEQLLIDCRQTHPEKRILLIVDGLDHIQRVHAEAPEVSASETRIIEMLTELTLPDGVCLLIGSQPGSHLDPLLGESSEVLSLSAWDVDEIRMLAQRLGALKRIDELKADGGIREFVETLFNRSEGNPLYATYLCREAQRQLDTTSPRTPSEVVSMAPQYAGSLNNYYEHLVGPSQPSSVAIILSFVDFALRRSELAELFPLVVHEIDTGLKELGPVLLEVTGQGGLRIYHESFRRFIMERLAEFPTVHKEVTKKLTDWLESRFPKCPRAYRFLLVYLSRQNRLAEVANMVGVDFVSKSVGLGYPQLAILQNIDLAIAAAANELDWPALCRLAETKKAVDTCFEDRFDFADFVATKIRIDGAEAISEQLLFEGKPVWSRDEGLLACSLCDDAGSSPPWREYLKLRGSRNIQNREDAWIAEFHGSARLGNAEDLIPRVLSWLTKAEKLPKTLTLPILARAVRTFGVERLQTSAADVSNRTQHLVLLSIAQHYKSLGNPEEAARFANEAIKLADDEVDVLDCIELGAAPKAESISTVADIVGDLTEKVVTSTYPDQGLVGTWLRSVRLCSWVDVSRLEKLRSDVVVDGWFRGWVRFALSVSVAATKHRQDAESSEAAVLTALEDLASESNPFLGEPRACDLYSITEEIDALWRLTVDLFTTEENLARAICLLCEISDNTTTYMQGSPNGPLTMDQLAELCEPVLEMGLGDVALEAIRKQVDRTEGGLYDVQARLELRLARAYATAGRRDEALKRLSKACQCMCAYGFRKDITIYELINSIPPLIAADSTHAPKLLQKLQPLVESLDGRTDGSETKHAPVAWFSALASASPTKAAILLGQSLSRNGGVVSWRLEESFENLLQRINEGSDDLILDLAFATAPVISTSTLKRILRSLSNLISENSPAADMATRRFWGRLEQVATGFSDEKKKLVNDFATQNQIHSFLFPKDTKPADRFSDFPDELFGSSLPTREEQSLFPTDGAILQLGEHIRELHLRRQHSDSFLDHFINQLGFRLIQLAADSRVGDAIWLIDLAAAESSGEFCSRILSGLAEGLERYGYPRLAALAFARAGWAFSDGYILSTEMDETHLGFIERARLLDTNAADRSIANTVAQFISTNRFTFGASSRMVQFATRFIDCDTGFRCWHESFEAIQHRLPEWTDISFSMAAFESEAYADWTTNEALAFLLIARISHPNMQYKSAAVAGLAKRIRNAPETLNRPLALALSCDTPLTSLMTVLTTLRESEEPPFACSQFLATFLRGYAQGELLGLRSLSTQLLDRLPDAGNEVDDADDA